MRVSASVAIACSLLMSAPAFSASMDLVKGQVSVSNGEGFRPATGGALNIGDAVMAGPGSSARVVYSDGCEVNVAPGAVVSVAAESPCMAFAQGVVGQAPIGVSPTTPNSWNVVPPNGGATGAGLARAGGITATNVSTVSGAVAVPTATAGISTAAIIGGGALAAGVIAGVVAANNSSNNSVPIVTPIRPVSP